MYTLTKDAAVVFTGPTADLKTYVAALQPDPFEVTVEGHVEFDNGVITGYSGFVHNGTQAEMDAYVAAHYQHV